MTIVNYKNKPYIIGICLISGRVTVNPYLYSFIHFSWNIWTVGSSLKLFYNRETEWAAIIMYCIAILSFLSLNVFALWVGKPTRVIDINVLMGPPEIERNDSGEE